MSSYLELSQLPEVAHMKLLGKFQGIPRGTSRELLEEAPNGASRVSYLGGPMGALRSS